jgi:thiamine biosynthesis protein ThiS
MQVFVNGQPRDVSDATTVLRLLATLELDRNQLAVELNRRVIPREDHATTKLAEGDQLEIVTLVGGGH